MFIAHQVSIEVVKALRPLVAVLKPQDKDLADQILRAASSVALNLGEGSKREGRDRGYHYRIAAGSCAEVRSALQVASGWGYLDGLDLSAIESLLDREAALLYRLAHPRAA